MKFRLVPTDDKFFELFDDSAENVAGGARVLQKLPADFDGLPRYPCSCRWPMSRSRSSPSWRR